MMSADLTPRKLINNTADPPSFRCLLILCVNAGTCALKSFIHVQCLLYFSPYVMADKQTKPRLSHTISLTKACQCKHLLLLQSPLFCCCCSISSVLFFYETTAHDSVATLWNNWLLKNKFNVHVRPAHTKYTRLQKPGGAHTVLMIKSVSRTLYTVPRIRIKVKYALRHITRGVDKDFILWIMIQSQIRSH